jgi:hypothetical protein
VLRHRVRDLFASISADGTAESTPQGELLIRLPAHVLGGAVTLRRRRKLARTVGEACTRPAIEVMPSATVARAAEVMRDHNVARLVVVDDSEIVGVVSRHDVLKALVRNDVETQAVASVACSPTSARTASWPRSTGASQNSPVAHRRAAERTASWIRWNASTGSWVWMRTSRGKSMT